VIDGNKPPTYEGVSQTQIEVYISKLYIDLLGLQATQLEITNGVSYLKLRDAIKPLEKCLCMMC
jgi:hypothetical protein